MKTFIFTKNTLADKIILKNLDSTLPNSEVVGSRVDLSAIDNSDDALIVVVNQGLYSTLKIDKFLRFLDRYKSNPIVVLNKIKSFGAFFFKENFEVASVTTNKCYLFSGVVYIPKGTLDKVENKTMSNLFKSIDIKDWKTFILK